MENADIWRIHESEIKGQECFHISTDSVAVRRQKYGENIIFTSIYLEKQIKKVILQKAIHYQKINWYLTFQYQSTISVISLFKAKLLSNSKFLSTNLKKWSLL